MSTTTDRLKKRCSFYLLALPAATFPSLLCAQENQPPSPLKATDKIVAVPLLSDQEFYLSLAVLGFGILVVLIEYRLLSKIEAGANDILRILTVTLIIVISLALVASGYGKEQITPVISLFATIVGYILGAAKSEGGTDKRKE